MAADTSGKEGRGPRRQKKTYWWIVIVVSIASGVGLILYFSIPVFFSPGGGIGAPTNMKKNNNHHQLERLRKEIWPMMFSLNNEGFRINRLKKFRYFSSLNSLYIPFFLLRHLRYLFY